MASGIGLPIPNGSLPTHSSMAFSPVSEGIKLALPKQMIGASHEVVFMHNNAYSPQDPLAMALLYF